jgi:phage repressor protein C with HTH and peptisase S24 domain
MKMEIGPGADVSKLADQVKTEREKRGWSAATLAERARKFAEAEGFQMKLTQQSISNFELSGAKRIPLWIKHVKQAFEQDPDGDLPMDDPDQAREDLVYIRQVDISYAMGEGAVIDDYPSTGLIPFNHQFLRSVARGNIETLFIARGQGDSMMPTLINDDLVLVDTSQQIISESDRIWAIVVGGGGMIKRVRRLPRDRYAILSDNPIVPPQEVDHDDLHVVGRVVWVGRRV